MDGQDIIDAFGKKIDEIIKDNDIELLVRMPAGTMEVDIDSSFNEPTLDWYILMHANKKAVMDIINSTDFDKSKLRDMLEGMFEMLIDDIVEEAADDKSGAG